jgi:hypothetical protein
MALPDYITHHFLVSIVTPAPCSAGRRIILPARRGSKKNIATAVLE